ncbi:MAG TPA: hypothetical protein VHE55_09825 [Fimbriimonadaceae bacterium]|nr:hypothetical protein [Fimbriimonadaceae bacterium]
MLTLRSVVPSKWVKADGDRGFSICFEGPPTPELDQHIYYLSHPRLGEISLFLVPISGDATKREYEAVFN